jgi:NAD(P)-dependent dehydrogenase (short-subunit alcohol dehydrogenase family)
VRQNGLEFSTSEWQTRMWTYIDRMWRRAKSPVAVPLGPVQMLVTLRRRIRVSNNKYRRTLQARMNGNHASSTAVLELLSSPETVARPTPVLSTGEMAVVVGVGPGLGHGVAGRLSAAGFKVALASRNAERLDQLVATLREANPWVRAYGCDATHQASVADMFQHAVEDFGEPTLVVYAVQDGGRVRLLDAEPAAVEDAWRSNCLGALLVTQEAGRRMVARGRGTIVLVGATSGLIGRAGYLHFALGKFGLRALAQVAARELGPQGVHVAHLVIDAEIAEAENEACTQPTMRAIDIAEVVYQLHRQPRSSWTHELDARPFDERFWEHC